MGQKINPHGFRVGVIKDWDSRWFTSKKEFGDTLVEDHKIEKNSVTVFTPNLNRAFKAKNILAKIGAVSTKMKSGFSNKTLFEETKTAFTNLVGDLHQNLPRSQSRSALKIGISEK